MAIVIPHVFQDGVNETASGVQVDENFDVLKSAVEGVEGTTASNSATLAALITGFGQTGLRAQVGSLSAPGSGGGRYGIDITLPFAWPVAHLLVLAQMVNDSSHIAYGPTSAVVLTNGTFHFDSESSPNFEAAHINWLSVGH